MKKIIFLALFLSFICFTAESALPRLSKSASSTKVNQETSESSNNNGLIIMGGESTDSSQSTGTFSVATGTQNTGLAVLPDGKAYVGVSSYLSLREEPFGRVLARLYDNDEVIIVNRDGDWYEVDSVRGSGWVYGQCIFASPNCRNKGVYSPYSVVSDNSDATASSSGNGTYNYSTFSKPSDYTVKLGNAIAQAARKIKTSTKKTTTTKTNNGQKTTTTSFAAATTPRSSTESGSLQSKIVSAAKNLVSKYSKRGSFPYAAATNKGKLGCAQVATTALKNAGALKTTNLSCVGTKELLEKAGWKKAKVPPYQAGDVIFWQGTQKKKGPTHVGIIMENGNNVQAMSNSSSQRRPRLHNANYAKLYCVMRKA